MGTWTNADRAERARAALATYISHTGDSPNANDTDTWIKDLACDLRHLADVEGIENVEATFVASVFNYEAEVQEEEAEAEPA